MCREVMVRHSSKSKKRKKSAFFSSQDAMTKEKFLAAVAEEQKRRRDEVKKEARFARPSSEEQAEIAEEKAPAVPGGDSAVAENAGGTAQDTMQAGKSESQSAPEDMREKNGAGEMKELPAHSEGVEPAEAAAASEADEPAETVEPAEESEIADVAEADGGVPTSKMTASAAPAEVVVKSETRTVSEERTFTAEETAGGAVSDGGAVAAMTADEESSASATVSQGTGELPSEEADALRRRALLQKLRRLAKEQKKSLSGKEKSEATSGETEDGEWVEWNSRNEWKHLPKPLLLPAAAALVLFLCLVIYTQYQRMVDPNLQPRRAERLVSGREVASPEESLEEDQLYSSKMLQPDAYRSDRFLTLTSPQDEEAEQEDEVETEENGEELRRTLPAYKLEGEGTEKSPYLIRSAQDLVFLQEALSTVTRDNPYPTAYYKQTADIKMNDFDGKEMLSVYKGEKQATYNWKPIGTALRPFRGVYDGDHHKILGLYYEQDARSLKQRPLAGLFGAAYNATFRNLEIDGAVILAKGHLFTGALAGQLSGKLNLEGVSVKAYLESDGAVGGIAGRIDGRQSEATAQKLHFEGEIHALWSETREEGEAKKPQTEENKKKETADQEGESAAQLSTQKSTLPLEQQMAGGLAATAENLNLKDFRNDGHLFSAGIAAGVIGTYSLSEDRVLSGLENHGTVFAHRWAAGLISSADFSGSACLTWKDSTNAGKVKGLVRAAGVADAVSLYAQNLGLRGMMNIENLENRGEIVGREAAGALTRVLLGPDQYFSLLSFKNRGRILAETVAAGVVADWVSTGGEARILQSVNEKEGEVLTQPSTEGLIHGTAAGLVGHMVIQAEEKHSAPHLLIQGNSNFGSVGAAQGAAGLIGDSLLRAPRTTLLTLRRPLLEIAQNIQFGTVHDAYSLSGLVGAFELAGQKELASLHGEPKIPYFVIRDNAVYGTVGNHFFDSRNYMAGLFAGPRLIYNGYDSSQGEDAAGSDGADKAGTETVAASGVSETSVAVPAADSSGAGGGSTASLSVQSAPAAATTSSAREAVPAKESPRFGILEHNLFAGQFFIRDDVLEKDRRYRDELVRCLSRQTAGIARSFPGLALRENFALPYANDFGRDADYVTGYQLPQLFAIGKARAENSADAAILRGDQAHEAQSYRGFDFKKIWVMDKEAKLPVPVQ